MHRYLLAMALLAAVACGQGERVGAALTWVDSSPHRQQFVTVEPGVSLEVLDWGGTGTPLVFLSGLQDVAHGFDEFAPQFTDTHHVLAITRRGYGASSKPSAGYDLATRVADLTAVLDSLNLREVMLAGHSIAGDELTAFAGAHPDRVLGLIYLDAAYDHSNLAQILSGYPQPPPMQAADSASPLAVQAYIKRTFGAHIPEAQLRAIATYDATGRLRKDVTPTSIDSMMLAGAGHPDYSRVRAPALLIDAKADSAPQMFPLWAEMSDAGRDSARRVFQLFQDKNRAERATIRRDMPTAVIVEIDGANHYVFDSHPAEVVAAMRRFTSGLEPAPPA